MTVSVRNHGTLYNRLAPATRSVVYLNDGTCVFGFLDVNQSDTTGDGGDGTGISKLYLYYGTNPATEDRVWTLKNTITIGASALNARAEAWSMAIDSGNNIHIAYVKKSDQSVQYIKLTYSSSGPTWTPSAAVTAIAAPGAGVTMSRVDIDCISSGTDNPVIVAYRNATTSPSINVAVAVKNNSAAWVAATLWLISSTAYSTSGEEHISVSASYETTPDGTGNHYFCVAGRFKSSSTDYGVLARVYQVNLTTGVVASTVNLNGGNSIFPSVGTYAKPYTFYRESASNSKKWLIVSSGQTNGATAGSVTRYNIGAGYSVDASMVATQDLANAVSYDPNTGGYADLSGGVQPCAMLYNRADKGLLVQFTVQGYFASYSGWIDSTALSINSQAQTDQNGFWVSTGGLGVAGAYTGTSQSRNVSANCCDHFQIIAVSGYYNIYTERNLVTSDTSAIRVPAQGSTVNNNRPSLSVYYYKSGYRSFPRPVKTQFQFATDSGFTTNLKSFIEDGSYFERPSTALEFTSPGWVSSKVYTLGSSLFQGSWYARSRLIDSFGQVGPWTVFTTPYNVSHPPSPANLQPAQALQIVLYGSPTTFTWEFSDSALPYDSQTAFQLQILSSVDNSIVYDSGKTISTSKSTQATIGAGYKDIPLYFQLKLWDSDDIAGAYVQSAGLFMVTDPPVVTVTAPAAGTISTGIPTVTWTNGITLPKTQTNYRVTVSSAGTTIYDTSWVLSSATTFKIPPGVMYNGISYTITVSVRDSNGLEASNQVIVTTSYTLPGAPASGSVYMFEYKNRGFVYISVDPTGYDADFQSYVLWRRRYGTSTWTEIHSWSTPTSRMVYQDFTATPNTTWEYAVSQIVNRFGDLVESNKLTLRTVTPSDDRYWMFSPSNPELSFPMFAVTDDGYTDEYETETYNIIGRGRHTDFGDHLGVNGQITVKMRDRMLTGTAKVNYAKNSQVNVRTVANGDPTSWTTESGGTIGTKTISYISGNEPHPTGDTEAVAINASAMGTTLNTDYVGIYQDLARADQPFAASDVVTFSVWIGGLPTAVNVNLIIVTYNSSNAQLSTTGDTVAVTPTEYYFTTPTASDPDYGAGLSTQYWARYARTVTLPANFDHMRVYVRMRGTGSGTAGLSKTLLLTGAQVEKSSSASAYIDGNQLGGSWRGDPGLAGGETTGYYTARQMKQRLEAFKENREFGYLRTPFGDLYAVSLGNISISRIAGVGANEFADASIPYTQVAF